MSNPKYPGLQTHRWKDNPEEKAFALAWLDQQKGKLLSYLLSTDPYPPPPSLDQEKTAATVIQWLGSPVGRGFLESLGYTKGSPASFDSTLDAELRLLAEEARLASKDVRSLLDWVDRALNGENPGFPVGLPELPSKVAGLLMIAAQFHRVQDGKRSWLKRIFGEKSVARIMQPIAKTGLKTKTAKK